MITEPRRLSRKRVNEIVSKLSRLTYNFCHEYVIDMHGRKAAERAGYKGVTAKNTASKLLRKENVRRYIEHLIAVELESRGITKDKVLRELSGIAFGRIEDLVEYDEDGVMRLKPLDDIAYPEMLKSIKVTTVKDINGNVIGTVTDFTAHSKIEALKILSKYTGLIDSPLFKSTDIDITEPPVIINIDHRQPIKLNKKINE